MENNDIIGRHQLSIEVWLMSEVCQCITLCKPAVVEVSNSVRVEKDGRVLPVFILGGEFHVTDDAVHAVRVRCPRAASPVTWSSVTSTSQRQAV